MNISARDFDDDVLVFLFSFTDMVFNNEVVAVMRPDGELGWMPAPRLVDTPYICNCCGGTGFLSAAQAELIGADFRLDNLCPDCHGTGVSEARACNAPTEPLTRPGQPLDRDGA